MWTAGAGTDPASFAGFPCPLHLLAGIPCPGCGMTRACLALAQGNPALAWQYHPLSFGLVGLALAAALAPGALQRAWQRPPAVRNLAAGGGLALTLGLWLSKIL